MPYPTPCRGSSQDMSAAELRAASGQLRALGAVVAGDLGGALAISLEVEALERQQATTSAVPDASSGAAAGRMVGGGWMGALPAPSTSGLSKGGSALAPVTAAGAIVLQQVRK